MYMNVPAPGKEEDLMPTPQGSYSYKDTNKCNNPHPSTHYDPLTFRFPIMFTSWFPMEKGHPLWTSQNVVPRLDLAMALSWTPYS